MTGEFWITYHVMLKNLVNQKIDIKELERILYWKQNQASYLDLDNSNKKSWLFRSHDLNLRYFVVP